MHRPGSDKSAVRQTIQALVDGGCRLQHVDYGEGPIPVDTVGKAVDEVMSVDEAYVFFAHPVRPSVQWVRFVLGNDPDEVAADYTVPLGEWIEPLCDAWESGE